MSQTLATSGPNAITFTITSDNPPINPSTLNVKINGQLIVNNGLTTISDFFPVVTLLGSTISVSMTFTNPLNKFDSFETVEVVVSATDSVFFGESFTFRMQDTIAPIISEVLPLSNTDDNAPNTPIFFRITDSGSGVSQSSLIVTVNIEENLIITGHNAILSGVIQPGFSGSLSQLGNTLEVFLSKNTEYGSDAKVRVDIHAEDELNPVDGYFEFQIIDISPPAIQNLVPSPNSVGIYEDTTVSLTFKDVNGSGINLSTLNLKINNTLAIASGLFQYSFVNISSQMIITYAPASTDIESVVVIVTLLNDLASALPIQVYAKVKDNRDNLVEKSYAFLVRDYKPPEIIDMLPASGSTNILSRTDIRLKIVEDLDGYGLDFSTLSIFVDGYSILNHTYNLAPIDGYIDGYLGRTFENPVFTDGYFFTPVVDTYVNDAYDSTYGDAYGLVYRGFSTTIKHSAVNEYDLIINPLRDFLFDTYVNVKVELSDRGGNSNTVSYFFKTAKEGAIVTTAFPSTGTYKNFIDGYGLVGAHSFLHTSGIVLTPNLPNAITYYTLDGSTPRTNKYNQVLGTTKVFLRPILINRQGLNVIKYFSTDLAGNKEQVKQEIYLIDAMPPEIKRIESILIIADIPFATNIIPVDAVDLFRTGQLVRILDDIRPSVLTRILATNSTSNPAYIVVEDKVERLKVSRFARVNLPVQPIDTHLPINFDTTQAGEYMFIGSSSSGDKQADAVLEQFRVLNKASTDAEILADFTLLSKGSKFFNQNEQIILSSEFSSLEKERANIPDNTLVLLDFDGNTENKPRQGILTSSTTPLVDIIAASNDVIFKVKIKKNEKVDRELLRVVLTNFAPTDLNVIVQFEEIG